jgi:hypothetical protein
VNPWVLAIWVMALPQEPPPPAYPLALPEPDFVAPGRPFKLVDLQYELSDTLSTDHAFRARLKVRDRGFLGARFQGEERILSWQTQRLTLSAEGRQGAYAMAGGYRTRRFLLEAGAERITAPGAQGWRLGQSVSVRLSPDFELLGGIAGDTRLTPFLRSSSLGFLWQRGMRWEASGEYVHARERTAAHADNTRDSGVVALVAQWGPAELSGGARLDDVRGRFPRRQTETDAGLRFSLAPRLLLEGGARTRLERGTRASHHYDAALTWFGRRFHLPRTGAAAQRSLALARRATELGYNERRVFGEDERRAQRERLSLAREREELLDDLAGLYRAQVEERPLPLLGFELVDEADALEGTQTRIARVLIGVPWPLGWPWRAGAPEVPFLRLDLERERLLSGPRIPSVTYTATLTLELNREMDLRVSWARIEPSPLDLIRGIGRRRTFTLSYVYAFGR